MKLAFLVLLLVNLALFAWQRGLFGEVAEAGREPQRVLRQIAPEKLQVLTPEQLAALQSRAAPTEPRPPVACLALGDFDEASLERVQARLAALALGERLSARRIDGPEWFIVHLPPQKSRVDAERLAQELRARGVRDLAVLGENSALRYAVALGSFRDQDLAQRHRADLERRGIKDVRVSERGSAAAVTRFEIRDADAALAQRLAEIQAEFPQSQLGACAN